MDDWENLDQAFAELERECEDVIRGLTVRIWNGVLSKTPQFEGRMAASWNYSIGAPLYTNRSVWEGRDQQRDDVEGPIQGLHRGHSVAIGIANATNAGNDRRFRLGDTVWIANGVQHGEGPYSQEIEDGNVHLRAVNLPGKPVSRTLDWVQANFGVDIRPARARQLKALTIGASSGNRDS